MAITAPTLNSVSISSTTATLSITPPVDAAYSICQILYRKYGYSNYTVGDTYVGVQGVAGNATQSGLLADTLYQFTVLSADSSSRYSLPSSSMIAHGITSIAENNLFITNAITLLANSTTFQSFVGASTVEAATERIHDRDINTMRETPYFPCATVYFNSDRSRRVDNDKNIKNMNIKIQFFKEVTDEKDRDEPALAREFMTTIGKIEYDLNLLNGVDAFLNFTDPQLDNEPMFGGLIDESNDLIMTTLTLQAGF